MDCIYIKSKAALGLDDQRHINFLRTDRKTDIIIVEDDNTFISGFGACGSVLRFSGVTFSSLVLGEMREGVVMIGAVGDALFTRILLGGNSPGSEASFFMFCWSIGGTTPCRIFCSAAAG